MSSQWHVHRQAFLPTSELFDAAENVPMRPCPSWLGNFEFHTYGQQVPQGPLGELRGRLASFVDQPWNRTFLQRYPEGTHVRPHRDPRNNIGHTVIGVFGEFDGADTLIDGVSLHLNPGDALVQECTIDGKQGPLHLVSKVTSGVRYALILNTVC